MWNCKKPALFGPQRWALSPCCCRRKDARTEPVGPVLRPGVVPGDVWEREAAYERPERGSEALSQRCTSATCRPVASGQLSSRTRTFAGAAATSRLSNDHGQSFKRVVQCKEVKVTNAHWCFAGPMPAATVLCCCHQATKGIGCPPSCRPGVEAR